MQVMELRNLIILKQKEINLELKKLNYIIKFNKNILRKLISGLILKYLPKLDLETISNLRNSFPDFDFYDLLYNPNIEIFKYYFRIYLNDVFIQGDNPNNQYKNFVIKISYAEEKKSKLTKINSDFIIYLAELEYLEGNLPKDSYSEIIIILSSVDNLITPSL